MFTVIAEEQPLSISGSSEGVDIRERLRLSGLIMTFSRRRWPTPSAATVDDERQCDHSVATSIATGVATNCTVSLGPGDYLIANQLNGGITLAEIMPSVPQRTVVYKSSTGAFPMDQRVVQERRCAHLDHAHSREGALDTPTQACSITFTGRYVIRCCRSTCLGGATTSRVVVSPNRHR